MKMWQSRWGNQIVGEVEVERVTDHFVWIDGRRHAIITAWEAYHKTWEEAQAFILGAIEHELSVTESKINILQSRLCTKRRELEAIKHMKKPSVIPESN